jgi:hypothetical protein
MNLRVMTDSRDQYVTKAPTALKLISLFLATLIIGCLLAPGVAWEIFIDAGWLQRGLLLGGIFVLVQSTSLSLFEQTIFDKDMIIHRSPFGITRQKSYSEIREVVVYTDSLRIYFIDGSRMKIWRWKFSWSGVMHIIRRKSPECQIRFSKGFRWQF